MSQLYILWDDSHIWGLIAIRAARAMGIAHRIVTGSDIASGLLASSPPAMLFVPGGSARHKAESLGGKGLEAIRSYVAAGGHYFGVCGGAGLALATPEREQGLALCPWKRGRFDDRFQHFMSGHLHVRIPDLSKADAALTPACISGAPCLPVWWPGRFAPEPDTDVAVLACYAEPASDFWLADLPIADLPEGVFAAWKDLYGITMTPSFLEGQPCVVHGHYGKGDYILSYSHLETPHSPDANRWFAHLLRELGGFVPERDIVPAWSGVQEGEWDAPGLRSIRQDLEAVMESGLTYGLLFQRTDWLLGWRAGLPGAGLNNLFAAVRSITEMPPTKAALQYFEEKGQELVRSVSLFRKGCIHYLLAERLAQTVSRFLPEAVSPEILRSQREALFGPPQHPGGVYRDIMTQLDRLAFLQLA